MAKNKQIERNNLIIQYTTHIETLNLESQDVDEVIRSSFLKTPGQVLSIMLNGKMIYAKTR